MMRKVLLLILVLIGGYSYGQVYQQMSQYGVEFKRMDNDSVLRIPRGLGSLRSISGYDTAQIRYNVSDSSVYVHTGNGWIKVVRASGGGADSAVFATVHKLYTTIDSLGNLIISENLGNTNLVQDSVVRTYDGDGGELSFSNLGKFKVSASDSVVVNSSVVKVKPTSTLSVDSVGYMEIKHYDENGNVLWYIDDGGTGLNVDDGVNLSSIQVSPNLIDFNSPNIAFISTGSISINATDSIVITQTPPTLTTDYDVLVRDENTGKVGIATISGGVSAFVSDSLRASTSQGVNIKNSVGTTVANFGAANTTNATLYGATAIHGVATLDSTLTVDNLTTLGRLNINKDSVDINTDKDYVLTLDTTTNEVGIVNVNELTKDPFIKILNKFGGTATAQTFDPRINGGNTNTSLGDTRMLIVPIELKKGQVITGLKSAQITQGNYVGDAYNGFALYSYSGGTLTLIDSTTRDTELWKAAANSMVSKAFDSPITITQDDIYIVTATYNSSSQTTAPALASLGVNVVMVSFDFTNSFKFGYLNSVSAPPSSFAASSITINNNSYLYIQTY